MQINGQWVGWGLGDNSKVDFRVQKVKAYMRAMFRSYAGDLADTNVFDQQMFDAVTEMQQRLVKSGKLQWDGFILGVLDLPTLYAMEFLKKEVPVGISVEGHLSNMFFGPVADTFTQLEQEHLMQHQPTGYDNGRIPFNNADGVRALAENVDKFKGRKKILGGFSQGMIVVYDYLEQYGIPDNTIGFLFYGNPCRQLGSIAPWAKPWVKNPNTHGLDPIKNFGKQGCVDLDSTGIPYVDVWREHDIFAQNLDDLKSRLKAAVYQAVARGDFMSNPWSIAANIFKMFESFFIPGMTIDGQSPLNYIFAIVMACVDGISFLADNPNPHYSPYDIEGGKNWVRGILKSAA